MISPVGGSNNIEVLLQSYRVIEERPIRELESRRDSINNRINLLSQLKSKLLSLQHLARDLGYSGVTSIWGSKAASSSDTSILTVSASASASIATHTVFVSQLAKADQVVSNQYSASGTDIFDSLGAGTYTFQVTVNGNSTQVSVDIASGDDNETILGNIVSAVNSTSDIGIRASLVHDTDDTVRLVFISENTGADYEMSLSDVSGSLLSTIGMNDSVAMSGTSGGYVYDSSQLNAIIVVDGITIQSNSNTIENAVEGLTFTLHEDQDVGDSPVTVNVTVDVESIRGKIEDFIDAYNEVLDFIEENTAVNTETYERGAFSEDYSILQLRLQLRENMANPVTGLADGWPTILQQIGIEPGQDGQLSITNASTLEDMIRNHLDQVQALFNSSDGYSARLQDLLDDLTDGEGIIEHRKDALNSRVNALNLRIEFLQQQVERKLEYYREQFSKLQAAYAMFVSQFNYVGTISQSGFLPTL